MQVEMRLARLPRGDMTDSLLKTSLTTEQWVCCQASFQFIMIYVNVITQL